MLDQIIEHYPQPCVWPRGQGHRNFMLKFYVKVFKSWLTSASSGDSKQCRSALFAIKYVNLYQ